MTLLDLLAFGAFVPFGGFVALGFLLTCLVGFAVDVVTSIRFGARLCFDMRDASDDDNKK